jgi:hypothetical protein
MQCCFFLAGREESCFWLAVEKLFCLAEENVFGWQRRTSLAGREDSFWLAEKKVVFGWQWKKSFASRGERLWLVEENVFVKDCILTQLEYLFN